MERSSHFSFLSGASDLRPDLLVSEYNDQASIGDVLTFGLLFK